MNRLAHETSPYLLQHVDNPVDWWPWGEAALAAARAQDKPILLSVGYSACHWCHVMAHECFEDAEVAAVMNAHFINIKVDREERPDIDQIYQAAHQMLTQRGGGWPLTMFLTPDGTPYFGGTYFPRRARAGLPGFGDLLERVADAYRTQRVAIATQNDSMRVALQRTLPHTAAPAALASVPIAQGIRELLATFDSKNGGFGGAPKFPHPSDLALLREAADGGDADARHAWLLSLRRMAEGGLYDQLGGGFARYSVDERWNIPHFEKMLYDNGALLELYADAYAVTRDDLFARVLTDTAQWVVRDMQSPQGGYYAAFDADSEGEEGRYYVWQRDEIARLLPDETTRAVFMEHFGLDSRANFDDAAWHLYVARPLADVAARLGLSEAAARRRLDAARLVLLNSRQQRVAPARDDKILASWNGLMIAGMARAATVMRAPPWLASAQRAMDCVRQTLWRDGRLLATSRNGQAHLNAYVDDHAYLLHAALTLMTAAFRPQDLRFACVLADALLEDFEDRERGGFHFTRHDHEQLILRPKPGHDNAMPSGNGMAAYALQRLGHLVGEPRYLDAAARALQVFYPSMAANPRGYSSMLLALREHLAPPTLVVLRGQPAAMAPWALAIAERARVHEYAIVVPDGVPDLPAALDKPAGGGAWVCTGSACLPPAYDLPALMRSLDSPS
ncbi:MAG: thioredoxin domain-containing protein [Rhodocyclaceae bacterium]